MAVIHITGASGSGTTTLGSALASRLGMAHLDADNFFWLPTDPRCTDKRDKALRDRMLIDALGSHDDSVLSGSITGWDPAIDAMLTHVVFLHVPTELRIARLKAREERELGDVIRPGGSHHESYQEFIAWAGRYDTAGLEQRSLVNHNTWLESMTCPILRIEGDTTVEERVRLVTGWLQDG